MSTAERTYRMLDNASLWTTALDCERLLASDGIPYAVLGGVAVCLHGYRRNTVDVNLLICGQDAALVRQTLEGNGYAWSAEEVEFRGPSGIAVQFLDSGERAGKGSELALPDPADAAAIDRIEGLSVLTLPRLIEVKLACGLGSPRRLHRDLADVVELISVHQLSRSFARHLHKSLRDAFRKLVLRARGE